MDAISPGRIIAYLTRNTHPAHVIEEADGFHIYAPHQFGILHPFSGMAHLARVNPYAQDGTEGVVVEFYTEFDVPGGVTRKGIISLDMHCTDGVWRERREDRVYAGIFRGLVPADLSDALPTYRMLTEDARGPTQRRA